MSEPSNHVSKISCVVCVCVCVSMCVYHSYTRLYMHHFVAMLYTHRMKWKHLELTGRPFLDNDGVCDTVAVPFDSSSFDEVNDSIQAKSPNI